MLGEERLGEEMLGEDMCGEHILVQDIELGEDNLFGDDNLDNMQFEECGLYFASMQ